MGAGDASGAVPCYGINKCKGTGDCGGTNGCSGQAFINLSKTDGSQTPQEAMKSVAFLINVC